MKREEHLFRYSAATIGDAARKAAEYHEQRVDHWVERRDKALNEVEATIGAKVVRHEVTGGLIARVVVDYGNQQAWDEYQLSAQKVEEHQNAAQQFRSHQQVYETQGDTPYELDAADVAYFHLGDQPFPE